jgi:two-component system chemotaxis response regulator CheB
MPPPIRALIVADAVAVRRLLAEAMAGEPEIEVIGTAANEVIAQAKLKAHRPDVTIIVAEMPGITETVRAIRHAYPRLPIILFSLSTGPGAAVLGTLMTNGATACVAATSDDRAVVGRCVHDVLLAKMKALRIVGLEPLSRVEIVAIGVSTGGPNALPTVLSVLPADFAVPVLIVQHMPPVFTRQLAERLNAKCKIAVAEAEPGTLLRAGQVWLAPGGRHLVVVAEAGGVRMELNDAPHENSCRPSADPLFDSIARVYGASVLGIVMTGMGRDGLRGCEAIRQAGGRILVQDEATSIVWGMPGSVVRAGLADAVFPLQELGPEIMRRVQVGRHPRFAAAPHGC